MPIQERCRKIKYKPMAGLCLLDVNLLGTKLFIIPTDMMSGKREWNPERERCAHTPTHAHTHTHAHIHMVA